MSLHHGADSELMHGLQALQASFLLAECTDFAWPKAVYQVNCCEEDLPLQMVLHPALQNSGVL